MTLQLVHHQHQHYTRAHKLIMPHVLEVVRFITDEEECQAKGSKFEHVGYMRAVFRTKKAAASYYDRHNPNMRKLNAHNTWKSDWDPETHLLYIVREHHGLIDTVAPFDARDEPVVTREARGGFTTTYPTYV